MKQLVYLSIFFILLLACQRNIYYGKRVAGTWKMLKQKNFNDSYSITNSTYIFSEGEADNETWLPLTITTDTTTFNWEYRFTWKKGNVDLQFRKENGEILLQRVLDSDKNHLYINSYGTILFLERI